MIYLKYVYFKLFVSDVKFLFFKDLKYVGWEDSYIYNWIRNKLK